MTALPNPGAYPTAVGAPSYSGNFTPIIWETMFLVKYYLTTVMGDITNTNYEGQIKNYGDTVRVPIRPDMIIRRYVDRQELEVQNPGSDSIDLLIDRGLYFNALISDVQKKQAQINFVAAWSDDAAQQMAIESDREILNEIPIDAHPLNQGITAGAISENLDLGETADPLQISAATVLDSVYNGVQALTEQNVPSDPSRISAVAPAWYIKYLKRSELRQADLTGDSKSPLRNGLVGQIDTIGKIYQSNNLMPMVDGVTTTFWVIIVNKDAITFAAQMTKMQVLPTTRTFGELMRGLKIYGFKTMKPEGLASLYVRDVPTATAL